MNRLYEIFHVRGFSFASTDQGNACASALRLQQFLERSDDFVIAGITHIAGVPFIGIARRGRCVGTHAATAAADFRPALILSNTPLSAFVEWRSEEHTSELQSLMRSSYAVFCLQKKKENTL